MEGNEREGSQWRANRENKEYFCGDQNKGEDRRAERRGFLNGQGA